MGDTNQRLFAKQELTRDYQDILEVGSKDYGSNVKYRDFLKYKKYIGIDLEIGTGVDVVGDLSKDLCGLQEESFSLVICASVLEHATDPFSLAKNMARLLQSQGQIYLSVPFIHRYHPYPGDYWRFTFSGVKALFPSIEWTKELLSTTKDGEFLKGIEMVQQIAKMEGKRKYLPQTGIHMVGGKI